jgi:hypothetical protein
MSRINNSLSISCKLMVAVMVLGLLSNDVMAQTKLTWPSPDEKVPSYTITPKEGSMNVFRTPKDDERLGDIQEMEVYEDEHHVYRVPFRYKNVKVDHWGEYNDKGIEIIGTLGAITIVEEKPIVSVTIVGSGCSSPNYNIVEWWADGEDLSNDHGRLAKRSRIDNLKGQHAAWLQQAFTREHFREKSFNTLEEANEFVGKLRRVIYGMTNGYYVPGSIMAGLYENTAYFRIGDVNVFEDGEAHKEEGQVFREVVSHYDVHKIVIRVGGLDYEDPGSDRERYPADYAVRLVDVVVKK